MSTIKDNELLRQFETTTDNGLLTIEYAVQERKIFLQSYVRLRMKHKKM